MPVKASVASTSICFPITLQFTGQHIPSFKNSKLLTRGKLITKPEYQKVMKQITRAFESQLLSAIRTSEDETSTERQQRCSIVSLRHFDDSRQWLPEITIKSEEVDKGYEGCTVTLEII